MLKPEHRLAILLHGGIFSTGGKTGLALLRYSEAEIVAVIDRDCAGQSLPELTGIPRSVPIVASLEEALSYSPDVLAIGIAPAGGALPPEWMADLQGAISGGMSIVNGLHTQLATHAALQALLKPGQWIWDLRQEPPNVPIASARARSLPNRRVLAVGTDMAIGKMSASLELNRAARRRGLPSKFLATGQAGVMISGEGIALDAIRVDFAAGAVEQMVMQAGGDCDPIFIEGQGSLLHPGSTATLPLIRGSQPTHLILVHRAGQTCLHRQSHIPIPPLAQVIELYETVASAGGSLYPARVVAIALNTAHCNDTEAQEAIDLVREETGLPCTDPVRWGADLLLDAVLGKD